MKVSEVFLRCNRSIEASELQPKDGSDMVYGSFFIAPIIAAFLMKLINGKLSSEEGMIYLSIFFIIFYLLAYFRNMVRFDYKKDFLWVTIPYMVFWILLLCSDSLFGNEKTWILVINWISVVVCAIILFFLKLIVWWLINRYVGDINRKYLILGGCNIGIVYILWFASIFALYYFTNNMLTLALLVSFAYFYGLVIMYLYRFPHPSRYS